MPGNSPSGACPLHFWGGGSEKWDLVRPCWSQQVGGGNGWAEGRGGGKKRGGGGLRRAERVPLSLLTLTSCCQTILLSPFHVAGNCVVVSWKSPTVIVRFCRWCWWRRQKTAHEGGSQICGNKSLLDLARRDRMFPKDRFCDTPGKTPTMTHKWDWKGFFGGAPSLTPNPA